MGVLNVTPDSFSDGGRFLDPERAVAHGRQLLAEGAAIVDVGGESTRPGAEPVEADEECRRVVPVIRRLAPEVREAGARLSVDTTEPRVAEAAVAAGAELINDVSASLWPVAAATGAGWIAMHMQGTPRTMQRAPRYGDVVAEVRGYLLERAGEALAAGVGEVWIDPGIGFGKTVDHNLSLLKHVDRLAATGYPVLVGASRKSFLGRLLGASDAGGGAGGRPAAPTAEDDRLEGSLAAAVWAARAGAAGIRAHDVAATVRALRVVAEPVEVGS